MTPILPIDLPALSAPVEHRHESMNRDAMDDFSDLRSDPVYLAMDFPYRALCCLEIVDWYLEDECRGRMPRYWFAKWRAEICVIGGAK